MYDTDQDGKVNFYDFAVFAEGFTGSEGELAASVEAVEPLKAEQKFLSSSAELQVEQKVDIDEIINWLDQLWQTDKDIRDSTSETDWQEFIENVKQSQ